MDSKERMPDMSCPQSWLQKTPAVRRYIFRFYWSIFFFVALSLALSYSSFHGFHPRGSLAYIVAVLPAIAIIATLVSGGMYLSEETDEFQRHLFVQSILWGVGGIMVLTSVWGWLQLYTHISHFFTIWTFPFFLVFQSVTWQVLRWRNR
jgi:hypothetical protein